MHSRHNHESPVLRLTINRDCTVTCDSGKSAGTSVCYDIHNQPWHTAYTERLA